MPNQKKEIVMKLNQYLVTAAIVFTSIAQAQTTSGGTGAGMGAGTGYQPSAGTNTPDTGNTGTLNNGTRLPQQQVGTATERSSTFNNTTERTYRNGVRTSTSTSTTTGTDTNTTHY